LDLLRQRKIATDDAGGNEVYLGPPSIFDSGLKPPGGTRIQLTLYTMVSIFHAKPSQRATTNSSRFARAFVVLTPKIRKNLRGKFDDIQPFAKQASLVVGGSRRMDSCLNGCFGLIEMLPTRHAR
jgi:hypothetical protein